MKLKKIYNSEPFASIAAGLIMLFIFSWFAFLLGIMSGRTGSFWKDGFNGVLGMIGIACVASFCAGCAWMADHKNIILKVIGSILCFLLFSVVFVGCTGLLMFAADH